MNRGAAAPAAIGKALRRIDPLVLGLAILLAAALRIGLANYQLWFDEYAALFFGSQPFSRLWSLWMVRETNPPLFYTILHGWLLLGVPRTILWLRTPSLIAGILTIPVVYLGINRFYGRNAAAVAALMLALSAQHVYYSQEVRGYGMVFLAIACSLFGLMSVAAAPDRGGREPIGGWAAYCGGAVVAIYLHDTALLWPGIATLALLVVAPVFWPIVGRRWRPLLLANALILLCSGWCLYMVHAQTLLPNGNIAWLHYFGMKFFLGTLRSSALLTRDAVGWQRITLLLLLGLSAFGAVATRRMVTTRLVAACWVMAVLAYWLVSHKQAIVLERTVIWMGLFPLILAAAGLGSIRARGPFLALSGVLLLLLGLNLARAASFELEDWGGAMQRVAATPAGTLVVSGQGNAVAATQACTLTFPHASGCPFPVLTINDTPNNAWANGFAPPAPVAQGRLAVPDQARLFFIQRFNEQPLKTLQAAGILLSAPLTKALMVGPYPGASQIRQAARIENGLLFFPTAAPPGEPAGKAHGATG